MIRKVLIVDDSRVARKILEDSIPKDKDYELTFAVDGQDGIEKFQALNPDITFLDLTMPVKDGFQALAEIRQIDKDAIVIVVTADIQAKAISRVMELGAFTVLVKPPASTELVRDTLDKAEQKLKHIRGEIQ